MRARAASDVAVAPGGGLGAVAAHVDLGARVVRWRACAAMPCAVDGGAAPLPITLDAASLPEGKDVIVESVAIGAGRHIVHIKVASPRGVAWEALLGSQGGAGVLLFAGITGFSSGEEGDRIGQILQIVPREGGISHVLLGNVREDVRICGQEATALSPRALDPQTLAFRGASVQRLTPAQRSGASRIIASSRSAPAEPALAKLLVSVGASTPEDAAKTLTDGNPTTKWSEARPGDGHGEFVVMRAPFEVPIQRLAITVAPPSPAADGAAPRTFFLVSDKSTLAVTMPEDAWMHPGVAYEIPLAEPLKTACLTLVLDEAYGHDSARPEVTVAELTAYSAFDGPGATLDKVTEVLSGGGARADAAAAVLKRSGDPGLLAVTRGYDKLDASGRALAMDVAASAPSCEASAPLLVRSLVDGDREVVRKGKSKLERCGKTAGKALIDALLAPDQALRTKVAPLVGSLDTPAAALALQEVMGQGSSPAREAVRGAFGRAIRTLPKERLAEIVNAPGPLSLRVDLLRAAGARLADVREPAGAAFGELLGPEATMRTRYVLLAPLAQLARAGDAGAATRFATMLAHDPDGPTRARAAELAEGISAAEGALTGALEDPEPRVREAALRTLGGARLASATSGIAERLASDPWTFVRGAAAGALAALPASPAADAALGVALKDASPRVRTQAVLGISGHRAIAHTDALRARLEDTREDIEVRMAAARALGTMCVRSATDRLETLARPEASPISDETSVQLALAAIDALGHLHPADLDARLAKVAKDAKDEVKRAVDRARSEKDLCTAPR